MVSTQFLKQWQQYVEYGKELGTNFMQQSGYSLRLQSHREKGLHSFPGVPIPLKSPWQIQRDCNPTLYLLFGITVP